MPVIAIDCRRKEKEERSYDRLFKSTETAKPAATGKGGKKKLGADRGALPSSRRDGGGTVTVKGWALVAASSYEFHCALAAACRQSRGRHYAHLHCALSTPPPWHCRLSTAAAESTGLEDDFSGLGVSGTSDATASRAYEDSFM